MIEAINAVREKKMGYKVASKTFKVPRATLRDYVKSSLSPEETVKRTIGRRPVLTHKLEEMLVEYCMKMENNFYGLNVGDLSRKAFQLAVENNLPHPFSTTTQKAGQKWTRLFLKRHPNLNILVTESPYKKKIMETKEKLKNASTSASSWAKKTRQAVKGKFGVEMMTTPVENIYLDSQPCCSSETTQSENFLKTSIIQGNSEIEKDPLRIEEDSDNY